MPKKSADFPDNLHIMCATEMRQSLVAISYLRGDGGSYAAVARDLLVEKSLEYVAHLSEDKRKAYEDILANVKMRELAREKKKPPP